MSTVPKVLVADPVSSRGVEALAEVGVVEVVVKTGLKEDELIQVIPEFHGLVVRSQTKVTAKVLEAAKNLKVVGRAGVGIDNVDLAAATEFGVLVVNAPTANTIAAAEHGIALLCALSRNVAQADASMKARLRARGSPGAAPLTAESHRAARGVEAHQVRGHLAGGQDAGRHRLRQGEPTRRGAVRRGRPPRLPCAAQYPAAVPLPLTHRSRRWAARLRAAPRGWA